jgi:hypothetical protein
VAAGVTLAAVLAGSCAGNRTPERSFTTRAEAEAAGMFDAGGVPEPLVPASARVLRERRDLSSGELWARFEVDETDRAGVASSCRAVADLRLPAAATRGIAWWPELLRGDVAVARQHFLFFACGDTPSGGVFAAVHRSMPTAFVWRAR